MPKSPVTLRISLEPKIYRDIEISGEASLYKLAEVINSVFGFDFDHAFGFYDNMKNPFKSKTAYELFTDLGEDPTRGAKAEVPRYGRLQKTGKKMAFLFDYGDTWIFEVKRIPGRELEVPKSFWKLIKSAGDAPEQYPQSEEEEDGRPFDEKYEMIKIGELTMAKRRDRK